MRPIITLTTDFGLDDPFVGVMKGVILGIAPSAELVDITHQIEPQNILQAAYTLEASCAYFPKKTVHLVVVDPGVGGSRRPIAVQTGAYTFVGPDNGVLMPVMEKPRVYELTQPKYFLDTVSSTFHGRDIFAPAAAWIAMGTKLAQMGKRINDPKTLDLPQPSFRGKTLKGQVIYIDRFGNLMSNIPAAFLDQCFQGRDTLQVKIGNKAVGAIFTHYSQCQKGKTGCVLNSWNNLEIFRREADAAKHFNSRIGNSITITELRAKK